MVKIFVPALDRNLKGENAPKHYSKQLKDKYAKSNIWTLDAVLPMINIENTLVTLRTFLNQLAIFYSHPRTFILTYSHNFLIWRRPGLKTF